MANDVVVRFLLKGMPEVERALRSVEQAAAKAGRAAPQVRPTATTRFREQAKRDAVALATENAAAERRFEGGLGTPARMRRRPSFEGPPAPTPAMQRAALEGPPEPAAAQRRKSDADANAAAKARLKAEIKADAEIRKSREKEAKKESADVAKLAQERAAAQKKLAEMMRKDREKENNAILADVAKITRAEEAAERKKETARVRKEKKDAEEKRGERERFWKAAGVNAMHGLAGGAVAGAQRVTGFAKDTLGMVTHLAGGFSIADSVERAAQNSGQLEDLLNAAANPASSSEFNQKRHDAADVEPKIQATAIRQGLGREDIQGGLREMVTMSSDFETSLKLMPRIAELSRAEGAKFHPVASAAGEILAQIKEGTADEKADKVMAVMRGLGGQGKAGSIDTRLQAPGIGKIVAQAGKFAGDNMQNILELGALSQFARKGGAHTAATAQTAIVAFTNTFSKPARLAKFKDVLGMGGDKIFADEGHTRLRPAQDLIVDALESSKGDIPKMMSAFGSVMGDRAIRKLSNTYTEAEAKKKGTGAAAAKKEYRDMVEKTMMTEGEVSDMANRRNEAIDAKMAAIREAFDAAVQQKIIPALLKLVPEIEKLVPLFVDLNAQAIPAMVDLLKTFGDFAEANKEIIKDVAAHPVGALIGLEIAKSMGPVATQFAGMFGPFGVAVEAAIAALIAAKLAIDAQFKKEEDALKEIAKHTSEGGDVMTRIRRRIAEGREVSEEDRAAARKLVGGLEGDLATQRDIRDHPGAAKAVLGGIVNALEGTKASSLDSNDIVDEYGRRVPTTSDKNFVGPTAQTEADNRQTTIKGLEGSISELKTVLEQAARANEALIEYARSGAGGSGAASPLGSGAASPPAIPPPPAASTGVRQRTQ